jgi:hypothetical protein
MGTVVTAYTDGKRHKHDGFKTRAERDAVVKELRKDGWTVTVKKWNMDGEDWFTYEAEKER